MMEDRTKLPEELSRVIAELREHWRNGNAEEHTRFFAEETDWENAFAWRLTGRQRLKEFLRDYVFPAQAARQYGEDFCRFQLVSPEIALVEFTVETKLPPGSRIEKRLVHTLHLLRKSGSSWEVILTRIWDPRADASPPVQQFPEFEAAPLSGMQPL